MLIFAQDWQYYFKTEWHKNQTVKNTNITPMINWSIYDIHDKEFEPNVYRNDVMSVPIIVNKVFQSMLVNKDYHSSGHIHDIIGSMVIKIIIRNHRERTFYVPYTVHVGSNNWHITREHQMYHLANKEIIIQNQQGMVGITHVHRNYWCF